MRHIVHSSARVQFLLTVFILSCGAFSVFFLYGRTPAADDSAAHITFSSLPRATKALTATEATSLRARCDASGTRYLVTGAAGFIGYHIAHALTRHANATVVGLDNFNDYYPVSLKRARAKELLKVGCTVVELDLNDFEPLLSLFSMCRFTHVLHLAAQAGVRYAARNPQAYVKSNVAGSVNLLEALKRQPLKPVLLFASSSSVYGLSKHFPFTETDRADVPASLYAATKRSQELLTHTYYNLYGITAIGARMRACEAGHPMPCTRTLHSGAGA